MKRFECIKGMANDFDVIVMQGDIVMFECIDSDNNTVDVEGIAGWCFGKELSFSPRQIVDHFRIIQDVR